MMKIIDLDASNWKSRLDLYDAICAAIGSPDWHGRNVNAMIDSMIWGGINTVAPPYTIRIRNLDKAPEFVRDEATTLQDCLLEARQEYRQMRGEDVPVEIAFSS